MTSPAISAQGTTLQIGTGTSSAKTVSAVQAGYPTILTATAHGFLAGTVAVLAGISGSATLTQAAGWPVKNLTANTFAVDVNTTGLTLTPSSATATPAAYTKVKAFKSFTGFDGQASPIDVSDLDSVAVEKVLGLVDNGKFDITLNSTGGNASADAGLQALYAALNDGLIRGFKVTLPNGAVASFNAFVMTVPLSGGVNQVLATTVSLLISGAVTWA